MAGAPIQLRQLARGVPKSGLQRRFGPHGAVATAMKCSRCSALATAKMKRLATRVLACQARRRGYIDVTVELRAARAIQTVLSGARRSMVTFTNHREEGDEDYLSARWWPRKNHVRKMWRDGEGPAN